MGISYKHRRSMSEVDRWREKITRYYARWFAKHFQKLVCSKLLLKDVRLAVKDGWMPSYSSFELKAENLPVDSAFIGAKQIADMVRTAETFFGVSSNDDLRGFGRLQSIHLFTESVDKESKFYSFSKYQGMLVASLRRTEVIFEVVNTGKERLALENHLELSAWLLEKEVTSYDLVVEYILEIPFLK